MNPNFSAGSSGQLTGAQSKLQFVASFMEGLSAPEHGVFFTAAGLHLAQRNQVSRGTAGAGENVLVRHCLCGSEAVFAHT